MRVNQGVTSERRQPYKSQQIVPIKAVLGKRVPDAYVQLRSAGLQGSGQLTLTFHGDSQHGHFFSQSRFQFPQPSWDIHAGVNHRHNNHGCLWKITNEPVLCDAIEI